MRCAWVSVWISALHCCQLLLPTLPFPKLSVTFRVWSEIGGRGRASLLALAEGVPPAAAPAEKWKNAGDWLDDTKLAVCVSATEELGKFVPLSVVVDADDAQVAAIIRDAQLLYCPREPLVYLCGVNDVKRISTFNRVALQAIIHIVRD